MISLSVCRDINADMIALQFSQSLKYRKITLKVFL